MKKTILFILIASPAFAQTATPSEQALTAKVVQEMQAGLNCNISLITAQAALDKANARIKELEAKLSPETKKE